MPDAIPQTAIESIDAIVRIEQDVNQHRSLGARIGDAVGSFAGTLAFVFVQLGLVAGWAAANAGLVPGVPAFDPFPYSLLGALLSLEGVLLAAFVLMKQAHEGRMSERRSQINLQVNLLIEKEVTKVIQMLDRMSATMGTRDEVMDSEAREMSEVTAVNNLAEELDRRLDEPQ